MHHTFQYILLCQSPALFLSAIVLLISYFVRKRNRHVLAVIDLIFAIACAIGGIVLYYVGMLRDYFNIHDFYQIRTWGWIGMAIIAILSVYALCRSFKRVSDKRKAEKEANRSENAHQHELEKAKAEAYEAGKAEAQAAAPVSTPTEMQDTVAPLSTPTDPDPVSAPIELQL